MSREIVDGQLEKRRTIIQEGQERQGNYICGLMAGSGKMDPRRLIALGCLSEKRGSDSAGVGWWNGEKNRTAKVAQNPLVAYPVTLAPTIRHACQYGGPLIGHTRAATTGTICSDNAHPFLDSGIVFAHNGIITNYQKFGEYHVDSQSLIHGIKARDFSPYYGPVALVWIEKGKLHAFRKGNPLWRGTLKKAVYLASEEDMLKEIGCTKIKEIAEGHLYVFNGMNIESTIKCPSNKTYSETRSYGTWNASTGKYEYGDDWQEEWHYRNYPHSSYSGSYDPRLRRPVGYRAPEKNPDPMGLLVRETLAERVAQATEASKRAKERMEKARQGVGIDENDDLQSEIKDMEKLCSMCQVNPKAMDWDCCDACFKGATNHRGES